MGIPKYENTPTGNLPTPTGNLRIPTGNSMTPTRNSASTQRETARPTRNLRKKRRELTLKEELIRRMMFGPPKEGIEGLESYTPTEKPTNEKLTD